MKIRSAKELIVYQKAYRLSMEVFRATKKFPAGRALRVDESSASLLPVGMPQLARSVGEAAL